ncbi:mutator family transposase [Ancylobacter aquaticus]|uniref:Mutator family transposase n=1 Tax=Ancylobacter aquaticus TaxID=100 RepID=A0A4R1H8C9_ANCAQ|nr:mutator family transposase [Ancylobacter aquaticus]
MARRKAPRIPDALLDQLLAGADPKTAFDTNGLLDDLKKALAERALNAEMDHHLAGDEAGNSRNGYGRKTVTTETGRIELDIPRDRQATFDPQLIAKYQRRFPGFDDKIVSMYARGMSAREIVGHLRELYGIEVSPDLVSAVTDAVLEDIATWQDRTSRSAVSAFKSCERIGMAFSKAGDPCSVSSVTACAMPCILRLLSMMTMAPLAGS